MSAPSSPSSASASASSPNNNNDNDNNDTTTATRLTPEQTPKTNNCFVELPADAQTLPLPLSDDDTDDDDEVLLLGSVKVSGGGGGEEQAVVTADRQEEENATETEEETIANVIAEDPLQNNNHDDNADSESNSDSDSSSMEPIPAETIIIADPAPASSSWLGSWWGGSTATATPVEEEEATIVKGNKEEEPSSEQQDNSTKESNITADDSSDLKVTESTEPADDQTPPTTPQLSASEKKALDDAFDHSEDPAADDDDEEEDDDSSANTRMGRIDKHTPILHSDVCMKLLRKFAFKTRSKIATNYGGSKSRSILSYIVSEKEDLTMVAYRELMNVLWDHGKIDPEEYYQDWQQQDETMDSSSSSEQVTDGILGHEGDDMTRTRHAMAAFVNVASVWGHASSRYLETQNKKTRVAFSELLIACVDTAALLVAHGCLDGVMIGIGRSSATLEYHPAINMLAQSVFNSDLTMEQNELVAMKFLLTTGCREFGKGSADALMRGSHLLQSIRTLYHIYLTTESQSNKTTAKASLQQLVSSVFARVVRTDEFREGMQHTSDGFPSENHRDAFLVLRSICKLSMRNLPDQSAGLQSHIGIASSGSNITWNGMDDSQRAVGDGNERMNDPLEQQRERHAELIYTAAIHPALESKLLALDLIFHVLQKTDFSRGFITRAGSQFHAAVRNYLCVSLLKNCTSNDTQAVNVSLRLFVPLVRSFRTILKNEIEAFVTNVFFVILDSKNSPAEHKSIVVNTFEEICSDPSTLAEIFLNYDCDMSAVDLFHRIVNTLSKIARTGLQEPRSNGISFMGGASAARQERERSESRELRLDAMKALRQVLASLHASTIEPLRPRDSQWNMATAQGDVPVDAAMMNSGGNDVPASPSTDSADTSGQKLVEMYGSKKKRRAEESEAILRFNQKPSAGIVYAVKCGHIDGEDPADVAQYLLKNKDAFEKAMIGEYLGREPEYQGGFSLKVLHEYVRLIDFEGLGFDEAIRLFLSGFRLPGEAQKIDRIMEKFAERYTEQNPGVFSTADVAFILAFSIIMLNTDLHNPAIKEDRRMTKEGFVRNNRGICDGQDLPEELLHGIFDRIQANPISLKEDDEARERVGDGKASGIVSSIGPASFFTSHYDEMDRAKESNFQKERDHIVRTTEALLKRRRHGQELNGGKTPPNKAKPEKTVRPVSRFVRTEDSGLRDEYVSPMFDVAWGPALAAFSTAMESANGTVGALISIASDEELEFAAENAAETIEVCLTGFRFAICTAGLCGNNVARDAFVLALSRFSQLGTGALLEPRHIRCVQTMMSLARDDGELMGPSWEHIFRALSEVNRYHQLFHIMARNDRVVAAAAARRRKKRDEKERRRKERDARKAAEEDAESVTEVGSEDFDVDDSDEEDSLAGSDLFEDAEELPFEEDMDARAIDEANARVVYDAVSEIVIEAIYERSSTLSAQTIKDFVKQLCFVSRSEISVGGASLLYNNKGGEQFHHNQVNIYCLQKLVEVTHYNMGSRPRLIFSDLWAIVADHLTFAALHFNPAIAMYAVDSFRQLSIQYLKRDELEVFEFQKRFLKPLEVVMARSEQISTKELLLNCVDRIILVFKAGETQSGGDADAVPRKGGLKSGWVPILTILGLAGTDMNRDIAKQSYKILMEEIRLCLKDTEHGILLSEHFVETVNALLMYVSGPHKDICRNAMEQLLKLTEYLVKDEVTMPQVRRRASIIASSSASAVNNDLNDDLELWWPILLGLSRTVGDSRPQLRSRALETLEKVITSYFFPSDPDVHASKRKGAHDDIQTLQIVFRGILFPILEFAELDSEEGDIPSLPEDFDRFVTKLSEPKAEANEAMEEAAWTGWLQTMFDPFIDICISLCLRSILVFKNSLLVEEVLALLTNCLMSDSGLLAVKGLHRLEQFITSDLNTSALTEDVWAALSHMLRRCLFVRNLPTPPGPSNAANGMAEETTSSIKDEEEEYMESVREFVAEDRFFTDRRYVPCNTTMLIGMLLSSEVFTVGLRWRLFLVAGLGRGIVEWERAATLLGQDPKFLTSAMKPPPPSYHETAMYGRKWMNRFILQLASIKEIAQAPSEADPKMNRYTAGQRLVADETQRLLSFFLKSENAAAQYQHGEIDEALHARFTALVNELLSGFSKMDNDHLKDMAWIDPVLLGTCIQSKNENIRLAVQKLVQRTAPPPKPYPSPVAQDAANATPAFQETAPTGENDEAKTDQASDSSPSLENIPAQMANAVYVDESAVTTEQVNEIETHVEATAEPETPIEESMTTDTSVTRPSLPEDYAERAEQLGLSSLTAVEEALKDPNVYILDIRTDEEIALGCVEHPNWRQCDGTPTENLSLSSDPESIVPRKDATIILYCRSGRRANKAKDILLEQGYTGTILNAGGYDDLKTIL